MNPTSQSAFGFVSPDYLRAGGPDLLTRVVQRFCLHSGFSDAWNIDGSGDHGADVIGYRDGRRWLFQCKWKKTGSVGKEAVAEVLAARKHYGAEEVAVVTNRTFSPSALSAASDAAAASVKVAMIDGETLRSLYSSPEFASRLPARGLRPYQLKAFASTKSLVASKGRALLVMATGLGKTVVAGEIIATALRDKPTADVLVVADKVTLIRQLEAALWWHLPKGVKTHVLTGDHKPDDISGVACATIETAKAYVDQGYRPDFVFVDEAHHLGADNTLAQLLEILADVAQLGATATPWRGDRYDIRKYWGPPAFEIGIAQGMALGYLAAVNYRLFTALVDWEKIEAMSAHSYTVRELNKSLFLPQLDAEIRDHLIGAWEKKANPRAIVFCQTIEAAQRLADLLAAVPQFNGTACLHSGLTMRERQEQVLRFRDGTVPLITAVDILNEGIDIPDVNIVCFARVTHSRRIFVQQLGRGLRLSEGKESVEVLDFVTDVRRAAALVSLEREMRDVANPGAAGPTEEIFLPAGHQIRFEDEEAGSFMKAWLEEAADVENASDEERLNFPR